MTHQEILEKVIAKATEGGWQKLVFVSLRDSKVAKLEGVDARNIYWSTPGNFPIFSEDVYHLIFNHDFAKALWGEKFLDFPYDYFGDTRDDYEFGDILPEYSWQYHLQQMVIAPDPITYLGENL